MSTGWQPSPCWHWSQFIDIASPLTVSIVPAALLELSDKNAVIKAQVPTALLLLAANIVLLYFLMLH